MVSHKILKTYEFDNIEDYFQYILDSQINGNFSQVNDLYNDLSESQKKTFILYCNSEQGKFYGEGLVNKCLANCFNL